MKHLPMASIIFASMLAGACATQTGNLPQNPARRIEIRQDLYDQWMGLIRADEYDQARQLCEPWLNDPDPAIAAEGNKCFANLALSEEEVVRLDRTAHGGVMRPGLREEATREALKYLDRAIELSPHDLSIHQGRMTVLLRGGMIPHMPVYLEQSIRAWPDPEMLVYWLEYGAQLFELGLLDDALKYFRVMETHFPDDHRVIANIGSILAMQERDREALQYVRRAVEMKPDDPLNNWNRGRLADYMGLLDEAETYYRKGIQLTENRERRKYAICLFSQFLEEKRKKYEEACRLQQENCPSEKRSACGRTK